ncbi:transposase [Clostridium sp. SY8519]|uniref:transposase n=1 Tax=Clostridium sp. (strain SY8519) TaxID=1042156 RepID=UPI00325B6306
MFSISTYTTRHYHDGKNHRQYKEQPIIFHIYFFHFLSPFMGSNTLLDNYSNTNKPLSIYANPFLHYFFQQTFVVRSYIVYVHYTFSSLFYSIPLPAKLLTPAALPILFRQKRTILANALNGRVKLSYFTEGMSQYFDQTIYKFGTAKLTKKLGKYYLHIPVTYDVEESNISDICNVVGIDRGINFVVATYDSKHKSGFVSGKAIKQRRTSYSKLRKELQMRQTPSARRRLKAIGQRENRWMQDVNHCVSKALVESNPKHTLFVLEDLTGVRNATERVRTENRYVSVSWAFYDLEQKLIYKAKQNQSSVIKVDPLVISVFSIYLVYTLSILYGQNIEILLLLSFLSIILWFSPFIFYIISSNK